MRDHSPSTRMPTIRETITNVDEDVEKLEPLHTSGGAVQGCNRDGKEFGNFLKG